MKAYLITTGSLFGLLAVAHLVRTVSEWPRLSTDPGFILEGPGIGILAGVLSCWAWRLVAFDEMLLFYPSKYPQGNWQPGDLDFADVWFTASDGTRLHGWYCPCDDPRAVVLYVHGNAGNLTYYAELLGYFQRRLRIATLIFDYRGYGRSDGAPTVDGLLQDARAARAELARRARIPDADIVLMGRSLGGAVAVRLAAEAPARGLILESTFSSLKDVARHHFPLLAWYVPASKLASRIQIQRHRGPLLQFHGDADDTVPYALGRRLFQDANEPKRFVTIPGGDHNDHPAPEFYRQLDHFLDALPDG